MIGLHYSLPYARYFVNRATWPDIYYKTSEVSGEDAHWKISTW